MNRLKTVLIGSLATMLMAAFSGCASAAERPRSIVELFTSQGCSSCPPANANLIKLSTGDDVLTLSFAVTYWDYLGWKDSFGKQEFTDRQAIYEPALGQSGSYTPQMVINGTTTTVGNDFAEVKQLVSQANRLNGPSASLGQNKIAIGSGAVPKSGADVWLIRYDPNLVEVPVARGENSGATLPHIHVVHELTRLGSWNGEAVSFDIGPASGALRTAVLVQGKKGGAILSAVTE
jgi:hypothetical protein